MDNGHLGFLAAFDQATERAGVFPRAKAGITWLETWKCTARSGGANPVSRARTNEPSRCSGPQGIRTHYNGDDAAAITGFRCIPRSTSQRQAEMYNNTFTQHYYVT